MPAPIPTIDVAEADRRLREDPARPLLLDVREPNEFTAVRAPGAALLPTSAFMCAPRRAAGGPAAAGDLPHRAAGRPR